MDRKDVERLMGGGEGQGGIFTWRERNRRKVRSRSQLSLQDNDNILSSWHIQCKYAYSINYVSI